MLTDQEIEDIGKEHAPYVDQKFARAIESAAIDAFMARTGKYLTNDASREAAIADASAPLLERIAELERQLEEARKDAQRYRFASDPKSDGFAVCEWIGGDWIPINTEDLDAAITKEQQ